MSSELQHTPRVIESAAASTACQTCDSKFAYALTAGVLGFITVIVVGIVLLLFAAFASMSTSNRGFEMENGYYGRGYEGDGWDDDDYGWSGYANDPSELQAL